MNFIFIFIMKIIIMKKKSMAFLRYDSFVLILLHKKWNKNYIMIIINSCVLWIKKKNQNPTYQRAKEISIKNLLT